MTAKTRRCEGGIPVGETFRVSVRELVAFSYFSPDITPSFAVEDMLAGTKAHQAREGMLAAQFEIEKVVRFELERGDATVTVYGRMDAYRDGEIPLIHEIKLCGKPPEAAWPEHVAQAKLYGALLMLQTPCEAADIEVAYVDAQGEPKRVFTQRESRNALLETLDAMLNPWLAIAVPERERERSRDESIRAMRFPFADFRAGQRELAVQTYTAITRRKRLFASLPTGTGKSAAVLFPAIKALGEGKTRKVIYLTARTTARQSPLNALALMRSQGLNLRVSTVSAKEKMCPATMRCHPDDCPRARGHFLRQPAAVQMLIDSGEMWTDEAIAQAAQEHMVCPFELALTLTDLADVVLMDLNYAFDPFAQIARIFRRGKGFTLLIDEAHHALDRVRESLSGSLDSRELRADRALFGKALGRKHPYYRAMTALYQALREVRNPHEESEPTAAKDEPTVARSAADALPMATDGGQSEVTLSTPETLADKGLYACSSANESRPSEPSFPAQMEPFSSVVRSIPRDYTLQAPPPQATVAAQALLEATFALMASPMPNAECRQRAGKLIRRLAPYLYAAEHFDDRYAALLSCHGGDRLVELCCLSPAEAIASVTKGLRGAIFFSATLAPLREMRALLGGTEDDACFSLPSPFPAENLAVVRRRIQTRYAHRAESAERVAQSIAEAVCTRAGKYIAYFPSYAYMALVTEHLTMLDLPLILVQDSEMTDEARARFLEAFTSDDSPKLGLCVLGGLYAEGVDLPGDQLIGAIIVGVGLPTPTLRLKTLQAYYEQRFGDGFLYAWMIPALQKVAQAGGRVIRTERDKGIVLLLDDRYYQPRYAALLPPEWRLRDEDIAAAARALGRTEES